MSAVGHFVTMTVAGQEFGIPVLEVRDVLGPQRITRIPLAPPEIAGVLNLRGRIVTAIDVRRRLGAAAREAGEGAAAAGGMNIVVERAGELYSLVVDAVGEVLRAPADSFEPIPATLDARWREVSAGVHRLAGRLMVVLDLGRLLEIDRKEAA